MSRCGNCGGSAGGCTCQFQSNSTATVSGNGRSYSAINFKPANVPTPRPYGELRRINSDQAFVNPTTAVVSFDTEFNVFEGGMTDVTNFPTRLTAPVAGYYLAGAFCNLSNPGQIAIRKNGDSGQILEHEINAAAGRSALMTVINLNAGEYLELWLATSAAVNVTITRTDITSYSSEHECYPLFWAEWVRPL